MDGTEMKTDTAGDGFSLLRPLDTKVILAFIALIIVSVVAYCCLVIGGEFTLYTASPALAIPFLAAGIYSLVIGRRIIPGAIAVIVLALTYFLIPDGIFFVLYVLLGAEGVAVMAEILQRRMFYPVLRRIESIHSGKTGFTDRVIGFLFCIPQGMDTRDITIDRDYLRSKIPVRSIVSPIAVAMLLCLFLWMYVFTESTISVGTEGLPIAVFTLIMYVSLLVVPLTIYERVNARIGPGHSEFRLYDGFLTCAKKATVPTVAALIVVIFPELVSADNILFALMTIAMTAVMVGASALLHFLLLEPALISDICGRWNEFHPIGIYSGYSSERPSMDDDVPGTPKRNLSESFSADVRVRNR